MKKIIIGLLLIIIILLSNHIFSLKDYFLLKNSVNLTTVEPVKSCKTTKSLAFSNVYNCDNGYYKFRFLGYKKIFYYSTYSNEISIFANFAFLTNPDIDINTFEPLKENNTFAKDSKHFYYINNIIPDTDSSEYKFLKSNSFSSEFPLEYYKAHNIKLVPEILINNNNIYLEGRKITGIKIGKYFIHTKLQEKIKKCNQIKISNSNSNYYECEITEDGKNIEINPDLGSLEILDDNIEYLRDTYYLKDKNNTYLIFGDKLITVDKIKETNEFKYSIKNDSHYGCDYFINEDTFNVRNVDLNEITSERSYDYSCYLRYKYK